MGINPFDNSNSDDPFLNVPGQMVPDGFGPVGGFSPDTWTPPPDQGELKDYEDKENAEKERNKKYNEENKKGGGIKIGKIFRFRLPRPPKVGGSGNTEVTNPVNPAPDTDTDPDPYVPNDDVDLRPGYEDPVPTPNPTPPEVIKSPEPAKDTKLPRKERR